MKKPTTVLAIVAVLAVLIGAAAYMLYKPKSTYAPSNNNSTTTTTPPPAASTKAAGNITMSNMMFKPSQITVPKGGSVTWTNNDTTAHTVVIDHGEGPNSGEIAPGATFSYTFAKAGSYQYHCGIHSSMRGTIVVQ